MEKSEYAKKIIDQAHEWSFEGDCSLLEWMKQISQNVQQRAITTNRAMEQLNADVKRTSIALDNAANSITALQYTQFVESRCKDDDETISKTTELTADVDTNNKETESSSVILKTFLNKNLEMLRNCHEKYALDFEDSDEEEEINNCIYQPRNPYNERQLPHIYGSKLWKDNWHVGLCDGANDFSGDEVSEAFSESSDASTSIAEDNESYDSNTNTPANLSEWASSTSILNEKCRTNNNAITVQNAVPCIDNDKKAQSFAAGSDTSSTASRTTSTRQQLKDTHDLFTTLEITPQTSDSSSVATPQETPQSKLVHSTQASSANNWTKNIPPMFNDEIPEDNIFSGSTAEPESGYTKPLNQTKRKTVNLFDDDDFNSFMSDIVDKAQTKADIPAVTTDTRPSVNSKETIAIASSTKEINNDLVFQQQNEKVIDLFNKQSNSPIKEVERKPNITKPVVIDITKNLLRNQTINLFESPESSLKDDHLFPVITTIAHGTNNDEFGTRTKISAKSLFDDDVDDDDDDFLNVFGSKKKNFPSTIERVFHFEDKDDENKNNKNITDPSELFVKSDFMTLDKTVATESNKPLFLDEVVENSKKSGNEHLNVGVYLHKDTLVSASISNSLQVSDIVNQFATEAVQSIENETCNIKPQNSDLKETSKLFFEETDDFNDLFNTQKRRNSNKSLLHEPKEIRSIIEENSDKISTTKDNELALKKSSQNVESIAEIEHTSAVSTEVEPIFTTSTKKPSRFENVLSNEFDVSLEPTDDIAQNNINKNEMPASALVSSNNATEESFTKVKDSQIYTGLFLDEPPDDDDFFQTLRVSSAKLPLDLEHDFYESALPQLPISTQKDTSVKTDSIPTINDYGGLCLFSDVPPEDDDDNINLSADSAQIKTIETNRLHSVFYDDFSETLEAVKQNSIEISKQPHALFDDEPPPDENNFDALKNREKPVDLNVKIDAIPINENILEQKDLQKQSSVLNKASIFQNDFEDTRIVKQPSIDESDKVDKTVEKTTSVSKLQIPNININVHALLPNVGRKQNFKSSTPVKAEIPSDICENNTFNSTYTTQIPHEPQEYTNENILTSVCKTRVRAPTKRRPSTRRGRQENYRKSLLEEQEEKLEEQSLNSTSIPCVAQTTPTEIVPIKQPSKPLQKNNENTKSTNDVSSINKTLAELFTDNENDDGFLFTPQPKILTSSNTHIESTDVLFAPILSTPIEDSIFSDIDHSKKVTKNMQSTEKVATGPKAQNPSVKPVSEKVVLPKTTNTTTTTARFKEATLLFADEQSDSDEDLFRSKKPTQFNPKQSPPSKSDTNVASIFSSDEDAKDNYDFINALRRSKQSEGAVTKTSTAKLEPSSSKSLFGDVESDDDDDLFSGGSMKDTKRNALTKTLQDPLGTLTPANAPKSTTASTLENNPLADLLNI